MHKYSFSISPGIAEILANRKYIPYFSYREHLANHATAPIDNNNQIRHPSRFKCQIKFSVVNNLDRPTKLNQRFHFCYGLDGEEEVYYERPLGFGITAKLHVKNLFTEPELIVNKSYYRFIRAKVDNLYPPGVHLSDILTVHLLYSGYIPVHSACIANRRGGIILAAPPDTGKTTTAVTASQHGFGFLAEDIVVADREKVYANPYTGTFFHLEGMKKKMSIRDLIYKYIYFKVPLLSYLISTPDLSLPKVLENIKIYTTSNIDKILFLDNGNNTIEKIEPLEALRRLLIINRNEFTYHKNLLLFAYSYFNPRSLDISKCMRNEEDILKHIASKYNCYVLRASGSSEYFDLILNLSS